MRTTWIDLDRVQSIESRARDTQPIRELVSSLTIRLARGCKHWTPWLQEEDMGQEEVYVSPSISLTYNKVCSPFENKIREIYFNKEVCFVRSLKFVHYL